MLKLIQVLHKIAYELAQANKLKAIELRYKVKSVGHPGIITEYLDEIEGVMENENP